MEKKRAEKLAKRHYSCEEGIGIITWRQGTQYRADRARYYFKRFLEATQGTKKAKAILEAHEKHGFTGTQVTELRKGFKNWWPHRRKKRKQGGVKNREKDQRTKPRPAAIPEIKGYFAE
jgi:hypothetical protein